MDRCKSPPLTHATGGMDRLAASSTPQSEGRNLHPQGPPNRNHGAARVGGLDPPSAYEGLLFQDWVPSSFFLELATKWAQPHRRTELRRALSVAQFPTTKKQSGGSPTKSTPTYPMIQVLWLEDQGDNLFFVRLHPKLAMGNYWVANDKGASKCKSTKLK